MRSIAASFAVTQQNELIMVIGEAQKANIARLGDRQRIRPQLSPPFLRT
jgi:hypothetical protein